MILKKIISGGQTGADRAALDVAIKFNIDHGGWIPKGRITEQGPLPVKYQLIETDTDDYKERTQQNILDSHGTLILFRGALSGGSKFTQTFAKVVGRPNCAIDLVTTEEFEAAIIIKSFILENGIRILNVAGPRLSHQPWIYKDVKTVLEIMLYLLFLDTEQDRVITAYLPLEPVKEEFPQTLKESLDLLYTDLPLKTRAYIAKSNPMDIHMFYFSMLEYIRHKVGFDTENKGLLRDCAVLMKEEDITIEDAVMEILKQLKRYLEKDHILRAVK